ncbi:MAG: zf-HC2 domain-containing protein [Anaerolineales bacterium]
MTSHLKHDELHAYLDGELDESTQLVAESHLEVCADCRNQLQSLRNLFADIESVPDEPLGNDLAPAVVASLRARQQDSRRLRWLGAVEFAAGLLTLAAIVASGLPLPLPATEALAASWQAGWSELFFSAQAELLAVVFEVQVGIGQAGQTLHSWQQPGLPAVPLWWLWLSFGVVLWIVANRILLGDGRWLNRVGKPKGAEHG